jgi:predicted RNA binding protein YcfA (HicA-like mRNA interferase family)
MTKLPRDVSAFDCVKALERAGFTQRRQVGSHLTMRREDPYGMVVIPMHRKKLSVGTLRSIIRQAGMSIEEFLSLL